MQQQLNINQIANLSVHTSDNSVPQAPPVWSNTNGMAGFLNVAADGLSAVFTPLVVGSGGQSTTIIVNTFVGGRVITVSVDFIIVAVDVSLGVILAPKP